MADNSSKPMRDWTASELVSAARERGTIDPLIAAMADKIEDMQKRLGQETADRLATQHAHEMKGARGHQRRISDRS